MKKVTKSKATMETCNHLRLAGNQAFGKKDFDQALSFYSQAISFAEEQAHEVVNTHHMNRALCNYVMGNYKASMFDAMAAIRTHPDMVVPDSPDPSITEPKLLEEFAVTMLKLFDADVMQVSERSEARRASESCDRRVRSPCEVRARSCYKLTQLFMLSRCGAVSCFVENAPRFARRSA